MQCTVIDQKEIPGRKSAPGVSKFDVLIDQVPEDNSLCLRVEFETKGERQNLYSTINNMKHKYGDASRWKGIKCCARGMVVFLWRGEK